MPPPRGQQPLHPHQLHRRHSLDHVVCSLRRCPTLHFAIRTPHSAFVIQPSPHPSPPAPLPAAPAPPPAAQTSPHRFQPSSAAESDTARRAQNSAPRSAVKCLDQCTESAPPAPCAPPTAPPRTESTCR